MAMKPPVCDALRLGIREPLSDAVDARTGFAFPHLVAWT